jgi:hypothetical protein
MLDADVKNGGFAQYFQNSGSAAADEAVAGLLMIGAGAFAEIAQRAIELFRTKPRSDEHSLEVRAHDFSVFDREYYALLRASRVQSQHRSDSVDERLAAFLRTQLATLWDE